MTLLGKRNDVLGFACIEYKHTVFVNLESELLRFNFLSLYARAHAHIHTSTNPHTCMTTSTYTQTKTHRRVRVCVREMVCVYVRECVSEGVRVAVCVKVRVRVCVYQWEGVCVCVCVWKCSSCVPHLTRWNNLHFGVGVVGITQKKVWAAGSPLSERWNKVRAFEE